MGRISHWKVRANALRHLRSQTERVFALPEPGPHGSTYGVGVADS